MENLSSIRNLAEKYGLTFRTLRFWEEKGLVKPISHDGCRRFYTNAEDAHVGELVQLKTCRFSLNTMRSWRGASASAKRKLLESQRELNSAEMKDLATAQKKISALLSGLDD